MILSHEKRAKFIWWFLVVFVGRNVRESLPLDSYESALGDPIIHYYMHLNNEKFLIFTIEEPSKYFRLIQENIHLCKMWASVA